MGVFWAESVTTTKSSGYIKGTLVWKAQGATILSAQMYIFVQQSVLQ